VLAKSKIGYDDSLDVVGVHGVGGVWGALATGIFASSAVNPAGNGLLNGNPHQLVVQAIGAGATIAYSVIVTFILLKIIDVTIGLRVSSDDETQGLDLTQHSEVGYNL
jgi:Amt family ammonium transporter